MDKLFDIKLCWDSDSNYISDNSNVWEGKILLYEDNWFEGFVVDSKNPNNTEEFVCGVYYPDKVIDLYKFLNVRGCFLLYFKGRKTVNGYEGKFESSGPISERTVGVSNIVTQCSELVRDNVDLETNEFADKIKNYIHFKINQDDLFYYKHFIAHRKSICELDLGQNEGTKNL